MVKAYFLNTKNTYRWSSAILQNCSQPQLFRPERYIEDSELLDPFDVIFGFGRRLVLDLIHESKIQPSYVCLLTFYLVFYFYSRCPGRHFADQSVWLAAAALVATVDILKARDSQGNEITPEATFVNGFVRYVLPRCLAGLSLTQQMIFSTVILRNFLAVCDLDRERSLRSLTSHWLIF